MVRAVFAALFFPVARAYLMSGEHEMKGSGMTSTDVCKGRSDKCSVILNVPDACAGDSSSCPIFMKFHTHGGKNGGAGKGKKRNFIGIAPQGEDYDGKSGWNDGSSTSNQCAWDDFTCTKDPNDGLFVAGIIAAVRELGANGRIYAYGGSNGAQMVQILAANAGDALPLSAIAATSGQLLATPTRATANPYNWNQPCSGKTCTGRAQTPPVAQLSFHGDADVKIPYEGGPKFNSDVFTLMSEPDSDAFWKTHNGCTGKLTSSLVPATWPQNPNTTDADHFIWGGCPATAPVEYYKVHGGGHCSPKTLYEEGSMETVFDFFCKVEAAHGGACPDSGEQLSV